MNEVDNDTLAEEGGRCRHHGSHCVLTCFNAADFYCCVDHFLADRFIETKQSFFLLGLLSCCCEAPCWFLTWLHLLWVVHPSARRWLLCCYWLWEIQTASPVGRIQNSVCKYRTAGKIKDWGCKNTITGCDMWGDLWPSSVVSSLLFYLCGSLFTTHIYFGSSFSQVWTRFFSIPTVLTLPCSSSTCTWGVRCFPLEVV